MSTPVDSNIQEDLCTFPIYQRLRKINLYAYNTTDLQTFGYSKSFMQYLERADTRSVLNVINRTKHCAFYCVSKGIMGTLSNGDN